MKKFLTLTLVLTAGLWFGLQSTAQDTPAAPKLETLEQKGAYAIGFRVGGNVKRSFPDIDVDMLCQGIRAGLAGQDPAISEQEMQEVVNAFTQAAQARMQEKAAMAAEENKKQGAAFLAENGKREGVKTTASGLQYEVIQPGDGASPKASDKVKVHYHGTLVDGTVFDSSVKRGEPVEFPVGGVIRGWVEALQLMKVGAKWKLYIPSDLAYGANPRPGGPIGPNATLIFEVELLEIK